MTEEEIISRGVPEHVAIILDGNGRWAKKRLLPRTFGHRKGALNIRTIARYANKIGVKYLSVFCFSTENWSRPNDEVSYLMNHPVRFIKRYRDDLLNSNVKITFSGRRDRLPSPLLNALLDLEENSKGHTGMVLNLCIDYGSFDELSRGIKEMVKEIQAGKMSVEDINQQTILSHLDTRNFPPVDLLIRTSGEIRISNFLMLQIAYAELYFTDTLWPDFSEKDLLKAIENYQSRNRRFGGLKETK
jgi:undecaprenyl diphosphate synthase